MSSSSEQTETIQQARPRLELVRPDGERTHQLVYKPLIRPSGPSRYEIRGQREQKGAIAWGFWGAVLVVGVTLLLLINARSVYSFWDVIWALVALGVGFLLYRYGKHSSLTEELLCEVDILRRTFRWPIGEDDHMALSFDEITELVFGMTDYPLSERREDVYVHAFTLLVRDDEERLVPVVEATPNKEEAHTIAQILSKELGLSISYVGKGI